jgi:hypothetical protein
MLDRKNGVILDCIFAVEKDVRPHSLLHSTNLSGVHYGFR